MTHPTTGPVPECRLAIREPPRSRDRLVVPAVQLDREKPGVLHLVPRWRTQVSALESSVLVLNSGYTAVRITNARRAFILLIREAAEVVTTDAGQFQTYDLAAWILWSELVRTGSSFDAQVEEHDPPDWVQTPRLVIAVPRVIRLLRYSGRPQREVRLTRRNIHARDLGRCHYCGKRFPSRELTVDHVIPRSLGGRDTWENLVTACVPCNSRKGSRTPQGANMHLHRTPTKPRTNPTIVQRLKSPKYRVWRLFVDESSTHLGVGA